MCIMEVRPGQHSATISQACAHNISTVERDLDLFKALLESRDPSVIPTVERAQEELRRAYAALLGVFGEQVAKEGHVTNSMGSERTLVAQAHHDAKLARKYETR